MSPLLKAVAIGLAVLIASLLIMWGIARALNQPFLPRIPRGPAPAPTPVAPLYPIR